ncbi:MAG: hypothetical protein IT516_02855 [Burkholderiales bacterium]|nr:hypothetical protein [Burkholderiales bacterium]
MSPLDVLRALADERDPETLIGPLFFLFTRFAIERDPDTGRALADHLTLLAAHPRVDPELRLAAGALAIEHRGRVR